MPDDETWLGGENVDFRSTAWSQIAIRPAGGEEERRRHWEFLARRYWKPIYHYIRRRWNRPSEDAKDLTQQFFMWMLSTEFLSKARPERGRFRNFVRTALENFLADQHDAARSLKRAGHGVRMDLDFVTALPEVAPPDADPEAVLNEQWRRALIDASLARLRDYYRSQDKEVQFRVFEDFYQAPAPGPSYEELAQRHGVSVIDVSNYLMRARVRFRDALRASVAEGVAGTDKMREEIDELFGRLNGP